MISTDPILEKRSPPLRRVDARRNYDKLMANAREAFAEEGSLASLEEIARRAEEHIGTPCRNLPKRPDLLEAVYVEEVEAVCLPAEALMADGTAPVSARLRIMATLRPAITITNPM